MCREEEPPLSFTVCPTSDERSLNQFSKIAFAHLAFCCGGGIRVDCTPNTKDHFRPGTAAYPSLAKDRSE